MPPEAGPAVAPETLLYRRIHERFVLTTPEGCARVTSAAFKQSPALSVVLGDALGASGRTALDVLASYPRDFLVAFAAGAALALGQRVERTPLPEEPAHGDVVGAKTGAVARGLLRAARWVHAPPGACSRPDGRRSGSVASAG